MHPTASILLLAGCGLAKRGVIAGDGQAPMIIARDCSKLMAPGRKQIVYLGHERAALAGGTALLDENWKPIPPHTWKIMNRSFMQALVEFWDWEARELVPWWPTLPMATVNYFVQNGGP